MDAYRRFSIFPPRSSRFFRTIVVCILLFPVLCAPAQGGELGTRENPLRMMFVPSGDSQVILEGGQEIARLLEGFTSLHFKTSIATSYAAVVEAMGAGKVDIGWLATFSYVLARQKHQVELLLIVDRFGSPFYRGQILASAKSGVRSLSGLKGKSFAFVDPASTSGHLYPKTLLLEKGYDPDSFFSKTVFAGSHNAVVLSILKGEVDGGATYDDARSAVAKSFPEVFDQVKVVAYTQNIPNDTVCVRKELSQELKTKIREGLKYLAGTPEGGKVLKRVYGITGLVDLDALFDPVRRAGSLLGLDLDKLSR